MNLKIGANVQSLVRGLKKAQKESKKTGISVAKMSLAMIGAAAGVKALNLAGQALGATFRASLKFLKSSTVDLAKFGDRMAKQARMVGVTAEQYQGFEFAAQRAGTSVKHVSNGLKKLGRVMMDAQQGSRQLEETFEALGVKITKAAGTLRPVNDVFMDLADRSQALGESAERTGALMLLLGRSGTEMANLMEGGAAGIEDLFLRLDELGGVMSAQTLADSEALIDAQADLEVAFRGLRIEVGKEVIPELTKLGNVTSAYLAHMLKTGTIEDYGTAIASSLNRAARPAVVLAGLIEGISLSYSIMTDAAMAFYHSKGILGLREMVAQITEMKDKLLDIPESFSEISERTFSALDSLSGATADSLTDALEGHWLGFQSYLSLIEKERLRIEGEEIKARLAARQAQREAAAELAKARRAESKRYLKQLKSESKAVRGYYKYIMGLWEEYVETFETLDRDLATDMFERREIVAEEFRARAMAADIQAAQAVADAKILIANEAFKKTHEDAARHRDDLAEIEAERIRSIRIGSEEASRVIFEQQANDIAMITEMVDAVGGMFSTLSALAMQAYEGGDEEAKKHAIAMFHIAQALALSTAIVNTAMGVAGALGNPALVAAFPMNIAAAAPIGAAGAAEIATIVGTSIQGIGDAGLTGDVLKRAGLNNHSAIAMRNDETLLDPVGTKHITEMLAIQKAQMQNGGGDQTIRTTVELDGRVLGESVDTYLIRQQERGLAYGNRVRQEYV